MDKAIHSGQLNVKKVYEAIAQILSRRGEGDIRLVGVSKVQQGVKKAG